MDVGRYGSVRGPGGIRLGGPHATRNRSTRVKDTYGEFPGPPSVELDKLREMLREQEEVIQHQVRAFEEQDEKSRHMIQLSVAALAGGVALASVLLRGPNQVPPWSILPVAIAATLNLSALVFFVDAYIGFRDQSDTHVGPDPGWVAQKAGDEAWTLDHHLLAQIKRTPAYFAHNLIAIEDSAQRRRLGLYWLLAALLSYAIGYIFILWEAMT